MIFGVFWFFLAKDGRAAGSINVYHRYMTKLSNVNILWYGCKSNT